MSGLALAAIRRGAEEGAVGEGAGSFVFATAPRLSFALSEPAAPETVVLIGGIRKRGTEGESEPDEGQGETERFSQVPRRFPAPPQDSVQLLLDP